MIVAICGNGRVGKDTTAEYLVQHHNFVRVGLADPLKRFCKEVFDFNHEQLWGDRRDVEDLRYRRGVKEEWSGVDLVQRTPVFLTPRYALQTLGTEWGRDCYPDVWIDYGLRVARRIERGAGYTPERGAYTPEMIYPDAHSLRHVVFSDLRFKNEVEAFKAAGAKLIRIYRPGFDGSALGGVAEHASEEEEQRSIPDDVFDAVILNKGTLDELYDRAERALQEVG